MNYRFAKESTRTHNDNNNNNNNKQDRILNVSKGKSNNNKNRNKFNETKIMIVVNTRVINNVILLRFLILKYSLCEASERN